jgi:hypothetical protein
MFRVVDQMAAMVEKEAMSSWLSISGEIRWRGSDAADNSELKMGKPVVGVTRRVGQVKM